MAEIRFERSSTFSDLLGFFSPNSCQIRANRVAHFQIITFFVAASTTGFAALAYYLIFQPFWEGLKNNLETPIHTHLHYEFGNVTITSKLSGFPELPSLSIHFIIAGLAFCCQLYYSFALHSTTEPGIPNRRLKRVQDWWKVNLFFLVADFVVLVFFQLYEEAIWACLFRLICLGLVSDFKLKLEEEAKIKCKN